MDKKKGISALYIEQHKLTLAGLKIDKVYYDSIESQFWASEQYKQDIPLLADNSYARSRKNSIFSRAQMRHYKKETRRLNNIGLGDQAGFILSAK